MEPESAWDDLSFDISISPDSDVILGYVDRPRRQIRWENTIEETTLMTWANRQAATIAAHIPETIDLGVKELALKKKLCKIWPKGKEKLYHFLDEQSMLPTTTICGFARSQFQALLYVDEDGTVHKLSSATIDNCVAELERKVAMYQIGFFSMLWDGIPAEEIDPIVLDEEWNYNFKGKINVDLAGGPKPVCCMASSSQVSFRLI